VAIYASSLNGSLGIRPGRLRSVPSRAHLLPMRCKVWPSNKDKSLHLFSGEGAEAFSALPAASRHLGPWTGGAEGDINRLRTRR